jgi:hypothetical protein
MSIKIIGTRNASLQPVKKTGKEEENGLDFQKIMKDVQANLQADKIPQGVETSGERIDPFPPASIGLSSLNFTSEVETVSAVRSQSIEAVESVLDRLEKYQQAMADPQVSLKKIDPLAKSVMQETKDLNLLSGKLPSADPLRKIMDEIGILSAVEMEKFQRGDYIEK